MKYKIAPEILETFPDTILGLVLAVGIDNSGTSPEVISLLKNRQDEIRKDFVKETLKDHPRIAPWRAAFSTFGAKPKKYRASIENLYRMILDGVDLRHINKAVDIYNYISIKHVASLGGDDFDKIDGDVTLRFADGDENYIELNTGETNHPKPGEVIYADNSEVLCRRWNWRQGDKTKIYEKSCKAVLIIEALSPFTRNEVQEITLELEEMIKQFCGGETTTFLLDKDSPEALIELG